MAIRNEDSYLTEIRLDSNSSVGVLGSSDLNSGRMLIVSNDFPVTKCEKALNERSHSVSRDIDAIFGHRRQRLVGRRGRVPVELHSHPAGPLDYSISANRIIERCHQNIRACRLRGTHSAIEISHQVSATFYTKRLRKRCLKTEDRNGYTRSQYQLRHSAAGGGGNCKYSLFKRHAPKPSNQACYLTIKILW